MSWNAPAAMYFVISVLPISMTSGALPPASVASNWVRCVVQVLNWTSTPTPGCSRWKSAVAALMIAFQLSLSASVCSQTVMLFVAAAPPDAVAAITARAAATRARPPMMRALMSESPKRIARRRGSFGVPGGRRERRRRRRLLVYTTWPRFGTLAQARRLVKTTLNAWARRGSDVSPIFAGDSLMFGAFARPPSERQTVAYWY